MARDAALSLHWRLSVELAKLPVLPLSLVPYAFNLMTLAAAMMLAYLSPISVAILTPLTLSETIGHHQWLASHTQQLTLHTLCGVIASTDAAGMIAV